MGLMSNKRIGMDFEQEVCDYLTEKGYWVHFIEPAPDGGQPFDIIAVKDSVALAIDCKTCAGNVIDEIRLEMNQILSFRKWLKCGNYMPLLACKYKDNEIVWVRYDDLRREKRIKLSEYKGEIVW